MPGADGNHGTSALIYTALWVCGLCYSAQLLQVPNTCHAAPWRYRKGGSCRHVQNNLHPGYRQQRTRIMSS